MNLGQKILDEIVRQPMFRMECPAHPEAGCLAIWNGNTAEQLEAVIYQFTTMNNDHTTCKDPRCMDPDCVAKRDAINPQHYKSHPSGVECIDITRHMDFCLGNAFKYLFRCGSKGSPLEDLKKARWYLSDALATRNKGLLCRFANAVNGGYDLGLDAPHSVFRVVRCENRFSGHMAAALGSVWAASDRPRTTIFLERALDSVKRMESIIVLTGRCG